MFNLNSKIYAIADQETCLENDIDIIDYVKILFESGIEIVQYRNKLDNMLFAGETFNEIIEITDNKMTYIINDHEKIAQNYLNQANIFLHVGQTDLIKNSSSSFGRSAHNLLEVKNALNENPQPEYIGFGAMFSSKTKPEIGSSRGELENVLDLWEKDIVLIGGITLENIHTLPAGNRIYYALINDFFVDGNLPLQIEKRVKKLISSLKQ
ncbi:MAG: thiamine phosphate synthase [Spirochaetia bacterium]|nr:thiamine phosphate synthase [Spirochaetia bacterium]